MKKITIAIAAAVSALTLSNSVLAEHSFSIGYAQTKVEHGMTLRGVNAKYNFEFSNSPLGVMTSFTFVTNNEDFNLDYLNNSYYEKDTVDQYNFLVGPSYRVNEYINFYGLIGAAYTKSKTEWNGSYSSSTGTGYYDGSEKFHKTSFSYGTGVQVNPIPNLVIDLGYEGSTFKEDGYRVNFNGFNIGLGYRF